MSDGTGPWGEPGTQEPEPLEGTAPAANPEPFLEPVEAPVAETRGWQPWSVGWSLGLTALVLLADFAAQFVVAIIAGVAAMLMTGGETTGLDWLEAHLGFLTGLSLVVTTPFFALLVALLARSRGSVREYLGLRWAGWKPTLGWAAAVAAFLLGFDLLGYALGRPPIPDFMREVYTTGEPLWVLWIALVVMAPLFEELLFRGFLIPGLERRWGGWAAVLISSGIFAGIHLQYDWFDMSAVLGLGLMFGALRVQTGSTWLAMLLHAAVNLAATVQAHWVVSAG